MKFLFFAFVVLVSQFTFAATPHFKKVVYVVFENTDFKDAIKSPILKTIADHGVLFDNFIAETHPSQPNYIAMIAGNTFGLHTDKNVNLGENNLADLLENRGLNWRVYAEDYPGNCFLGESAGLYYRKHVPFLSFTNITTQPRRCANIINTQNLMADLQSGRLANFNMIIPNIVNDGHNGGLPTIERWIQKTMWSYLQNPQAYADTLIIFTFDEGSWFGTNQIYTVALGAGLVPGVSHQRLNHIDLLGLIESEWALGTLPKQLPTQKVNGLWNRMSPR